MKKMILLLILIPFSVSAGEHWYRITTLKGCDTYDFYGTVNLAPEEFTKELKNDAFTKIDNLVYFDNQRKVKSWSEWSPHMKTAVYVRNSEITMFVELTGDPTASNK